MVAPPVWDNEGMKTLRILTLIIAGIALTGCSTSPNTDDPLTTQMEDANITVGGITDQDAQKAITSICNTRDNDLSHGWVLDTLRMTFEGNWSDGEAERFLDIAYANECPEYRK